DLRAMAERVLVELAPRVPEEEPDDEEDRGERRDREQRLVALDEARDAGELFGGERSEHAQPFSPPPDSPTGGESEALAISAPRESRVSDASRPSTKSTWKRPGLAVRPVSATRAGCATSFIWGPERSR